ncbi:malate synthase G [Jeotgalibacillus campisalis]|uniref:Malate synthase G n=1 Tax=Jeotgalibacillus campisalis TaxID=220754 RepID=A0A0C2W8P5_9BACL|nr:malate synthase G [Jeotgalibacillus campisalis]KIL52966.1 malate synthase [Jeotgalibacillus campisalis]
MIHIDGLKIDPLFYTFIEKEALPGSEVDSEAFWQGFSEIIHDLSPENGELLAVRNRMQEQINQWHSQWDWKQKREEYENFLKEIGYIEREKEPFSIGTEQVDREIASQAGPQLVVPVNNARYAINAANARWGSLYDALYGTNVIDEAEGAEKGSAYNPIRGRKVVDYAKSFLDEIIPLQNGSHKEVTQYSVKDGKLVASVINETTRLKDEQQFAGWQGERENPSSILLINHDLYIEIQMDKTHPVGKTDAAGVKDVVMESAITTIMDCEDSVAAVDAEDKVLVYRNWLGLMKGSLSSVFQKGEKEVTRNLNEDRSYLSPDGSELILPGRSLLLVRNVGHLMTSSMVLDQEDREVPEGIIDTVVTSLLAKHDLLRKGRTKNSAEGSVYIVKPKMHGSREAAFANTCFNRVEDLLGLKRFTLKIGVMDEERRTSLNLANCIFEVKERIVFINTGFLDRTGDEIHTSMLAGAMVRKNEMKGTVWLQGYEKSNVDTGLKCALPGRAQIGKGMWAMPDQMKEMMEQKRTHLEAGGNTAWVPSPTAATLHALHYHQLRVKDVQKELLQRVKDRQQEMLTLPLFEGSYTKADIQQELDNNVQGLLGYVVRWVEHGTGCSKVPDIHHVGLMEDRATLRISSQHLANWLEHGLCTKEQIMETLKRMAEVVDHQNSSDPLYQPMANDFERSIAFQAACDLIFDGKDQPGGYTEPILHRRRQEFKARTYAART